MSKSFSFSLSHDQIVEACNKLGVRESEIGKSLKSMLTDKEHSEYYPTSMFEQSIMKYKEEKNKPLNEKVKALTNEDLKKILGIKGNNELRKLKSSGLYYKKNIEDYLADFTMWWNGDKGKAFEAMNEIKVRTWKEYCAIEYAERVTKEIDLI